MPAEQLRAYLLTDIVDSTAQAVSNQYPLIFPFASSVPAYCYQSLSTLLLGSSGQDLSTEIFANYGEANIPPKASIVLQVTEIYESVRYKGRIINDEPGAETALIDAFIRNVRTTTSVNLTKQVTLRLRFLLDYNLRQFRQSISNPISPEIPINPSADLSIRSDGNSYLKCFFDVSGLLTASGWIVRFEANYIRAFPVSP